MCRCAARHDAALAKAFANIHRLVKKRLSAFVVDAKMIPGSNVKSRRHKNFVRHRLACSHPVFGGETCEQRSRHDAQRAWRGHRVLR
jgi:hypothetical protein